MKYRKFRDHAGRVHRVAVKPDELKANRLYWTGIYMGGIVFLVVMIIVSGVL